MIVVKIIAITGVPGIIHVVVKIPVVIIVEHGMPEIGRAHV